MNNAGFHFGRWLLPVVVLVLAVPAAAKKQNYTVNSVANVDLGQIAAAATGDTRFRVDPSGPTVTKTSGAGVRVSGGSGRVLVTVSCDTSGACDTANASVTVTTVGSPTKRASALENFTVSAVGATGSIVTPPAASGGTITFTVGPIGKNSTKTFYVGYDFIVKGDNTGIQSGLSTAGLSVAIARADGGGDSVNSGTVSATVFRTITASTSQNLSFGIVSRPRAGGGTVSLTPGQTKPHTVGDGVVALSTVPANAATIDVTGEGGQSLSVTIPSTFDMAGPSGSITVTTIPSVSGSIVLPGSLGGPGSTSVSVGGSFPLDSTTSTGGYSGNFPVIFQYN